MTTSYTSLLGLALPVTGELSGTWGDTVNNGITSLVDSAVAGTTTLNSDADVTLTTTTGASNTSRQAVILWTAGGTVTRTITAPAQSKTYLVINKTSSSQSIKIVGVGPTTGVTIVAGTAALVVWNGVDFVPVSVTATTGILPVANGGTGLASGTSGGVLAYTATGTLASSAALAASALVIGGGAGAAPSTTTTGTGVVTALGVNTGTAGAFVVNGGALGSPSSVGTLPALILSGNVTSTGNPSLNIGSGALTAGTLTLSDGAVITSTTVGIGGWKMAADLKASDYPMLRLQATGSNLVSSIGNDNDGTLKVYAGGTASAIGTLSGIFSTTGLNLGSLALTAGATGVTTLTASSTVSLSATTVTTNGSASIPTIGLVGTTDTTLRFTASSGDADKRKYEIRAIGASGFEAFQIRKVNDANTVFTELLSIPNAGGLDVTGALTASTSATVGGNAATSAPYIANAAGGATQGGYFGVQSVGSFKSVFGARAVILGSGTDQSAMLQSYSDDIYITTAAAKNIYVQRNSATVATFTDLGINGVLGGTTPAAASVLSLAVNSGATASATDINSTNASGTYFTVSNSGTPIGYIGSAKQIVDATLAANDFGIAARAGGVLYLGDLGTKTVAISDGSVAVTGALSATTTLGVTGTATFGTSQNSSSYVNITNTNAGASADARLDLTTHATLSALTIVGYGSGTSGTLFGASIAKLKAIYDNSTAAQSSGMAIGTTAALPLILGTNNAARLTIDSAGAVTIGGTLSATGDVSLGSDVLIGGNELHFEDQTNGTATGYINYYGYQNSTSQFRSTVIGNGKGAAVATFDYAGNLGLGVTPSAWQANNRALQIYEGWASISGNNSQGCCDVSANCFNAGSAAISGWKYTNSSALASLYQQSAGVHKWLTAPSGTAGNTITFTEAMTLDASGNLLVGTTTASVSNTNGLTVVNPTGATAISIGHLTGTANTAGFAFFNYNGTAIGSITQSGTTAVLYNTTSDYRLKTVIGPVADAGQRIDALQPVEYAWNSNGTRTRGFLAHEFQTVYPNSVSGEKDAEDEDGNPVYQAMQASTSEVIADLVAELQSLRSRVALLEAK